MKKINSLFFVAVVVVLSSCGSSYYINPVGELSMVATRNLDKSANYVQIKAYAGISRTDLEAAKASAKNGVIKTNNPIVKEINAYKGKFLQDAVDNVVKSAAGGEYLYNLKLYTIAETPFKLFGPKITYYSYVASGDVWGINDVNANIKGFKISDKIVFTYTKELRKFLNKNFEGEVGKQYGGKVINLKGGEATVQLDNLAVVDIPYSNLTNLH
jgi:hypothetical protein